MLSKSLDGLKGATFAERAQTFVTRGYEEALGQRLTGVELTRFDSSRPRVWKWTAKPRKQRKDTQIVLATKFIVDLDPDAFVEITVGGTADNDAVARDIIDSLRTTSDPECYWQVLEEMLRAFSGDDAG